MGKVLYFRSSSEPLILDEEQREARRKGFSIQKNSIQSINLFLFALARFESLKKSTGIMVVRGLTLPELAGGSSRSGHSNSRSGLSK